MRRGRTVTAAELAKLKPYFINQYNDYRDAVLSGKKPASSLEIAKVKRQERDLTSGKWSLDGQEFGFSRRAKERETSQA